MGLISGFGSLSVSATAGIYLSPGLEIEREGLCTPRPPVKSQMTFKPQVEQLAEWVMSRKRKPYGKESYKARVLPLLLNEELEQLLGH